MKKKDLYQLVKQSLKEVLQEQRRNRRLRPDDIRRDRERRRLRPDDIRRDRERRRLRPGDLENRRFRPGDPFVDPRTGEFKILRPDDFTIDDRTGTLGIPKALVDFKGDFIQPIMMGNCETTSVYNHLVGYLNDPDNIIGLGNVGGEKGNPKECQVLEIDASWICCSQDNNFDNQVNISPSGNPGLQWQYNANGNTATYTTWTNQNCANIDPEIGPTWQDYVNWVNSQNLGGHNIVGSNIYYMSAGAYSAVYLSDSCGPAEVVVEEDTPVCNNPEALNYYCDNVPEGSPACTGDDFDILPEGYVQDNSLCELPVEVCNNPNASNYYCDNIGDGPSCTGDDFDILPSGYIQNNDLCNFTGCTNLLASNYDSLADDDDGSCKFIGCTDNSYDNYICVIQPSLCVTFVGGEETEGGISCDDTPCPDGSFNTDLGTLNDETPSMCSNIPIEGCNDTKAENYNSEVTVPNNSTCFYKFCNDDDAYNYSSVRPDGNPWSVEIGDTADNSKCEYEGCANNSSPSSESPSTVVPNTSNPVQYYYHPLNSGCQTGEGGIIDGLGPTGDLDIDEDECCYIEIIEGCTDPNAENYNPNAEVDDGTCRYECANIEAVQCNPESKINDYKIKLDCVTINGNTPVVNNPFVYQGYVAYVPEAEAAPAELIGLGAINEDENIGFETCCCPPGVVGGNPFTTNVAAPPGCAGFGCQSGPCGGGDFDLDNDKIKDPTLFKEPNLGINVPINAAFKVISVETLVSTEIPQDLSASSCVGNIGTGNIISIDMEPFKSKIKEIDDSKKIRKALKENLYGISSEDKLKKLIKNILKKKK